MNKRITKIFCILIILSFLVYTPLAAKKDPKKVNLKGLEKFINKTMEEWKVPGLGISILKDGNVVFSQGFGLRDVKRSMPVTPRTLFAIGSCTKAFTAVTMGILVDEGKLGWDTPVKEYLPTFKLKDPFATEKMTPRDLVCHRSGLPRHDSMWYNSSASRKELFDRLQYLEPSKDFRTTYQYQNLMFMTAGYMVGKIAGESWERLVRNRIIVPLGMNNSNFSVNDSQKDIDFALPYMEKDDKIIEIPFRNIDTVGPAGSINSSVTDMANWLYLNLNKGKLGEQQIISEASLKEIHSPQMISSKSYKYDETFYSTYGMGWGITAYRGHLKLQHGGGIDGFTALVTFMPRDNIGIVILTNKSGTPLPSIIANNVYDRLLGLKQIDWNKRIRDEVDKAKEEAEKAKKEKDKDQKLNTKPSHPLEDYAGDYEHPGYGIISVKKEGDLLKAEYNSIPFTLKHYHYDVFEFNNELLDMSTKASFFTDLKGNIGSLTIQLEPAVKESIFTRLPEKAMMEKSFLEKFAGEYVLGEVTATVFIKGENTLYLVVPGQPEYELVPYKGTTFNFKDLAGFSIEFVMDESGAVIEAKITQPNGVFTAKKK
ncbi:MAG: serine hydrolase [Candidatus Aminicenantes bacterium]|nr:serine hydrolase [Candidatus Aminicenantes bacterium]MBL7083236.1 serine hydrolase [Candidatus Aminicenantes bacterium]